MPYSNPIRVLFALVVISISTVFARESTAMRESNSWNLRGNTHFGLSTNLRMDEKERTRESLHLRGTVASIPTESRFAAKHTHGDTEIEIDLPTSATALTNDDRGLRHRNLQRRHLKHADSGIKKSKSDKKSTKSDSKREQPTEGENQSESLLPPMASNLVVENEGEVGVGVLATIDPSDDFETPLDAETKEPLVAVGRPLFLPQEDLENSKPYVSEDPPRESVSVLQKTPLENVPVFNIESFLPEDRTSNLAYDEITETNEENVFKTNDIALNKESAHTVKNLETFEDAIEIAGPEASHDSLQIAYDNSNFRAPKHFSPVGCPGDVKLLKQRGDRFSMAYDPILDAIEVVHQDTSTVTVDLHQVWKNNGGYPIEHFYYYFHKPGKRFWGNAKCYEENSVPYSVTEKVDTIDIVCNVHQPYAEIEICLVDDISHGSLLPNEEDNIPTARPPIIPKNCHHDVSPTELSVCYTLEISCSPTCR